MKRKKLPNAMTREELQRALLGTLGPRDVSRRSPDAGKPTGYEDALGRKAGRPLGKTTGLPIFGAFCYVFQENQKPPGKCAIKGLGRALDERISEWLVKEFPSRDSMYFEDVKPMRSMYNRGLLTRGLVPRVKSTRFDFDGKILTPRLTKKVVAARKSA
jgi:hypothetical protein